MLIRVFGANRGPPAPVAGASSFGLRLSDCLRDKCPGVWVPVPSSFLVNAGGNRG